MVKIDELDRQILSLIAADARIPFLEVARACNVSGAAIHQRIQKLNSLGVLKGSQFLIEPEKIGYETCAYIGLNLKDPARFDEAGSQWLTEAGTYTFRIGNSSRDIAATATLKVAEYTEKTTNALAPQKKLNLLKK